ncbi:MAG TPA: prepilin-type N-terminal cleavage/methylation domain-containing protein [Planctomycetes bacterium]|nr:prepilin-type N-terminal cleavage/methylation domain-containing protein [Planctomycetota bacterium]
MTRNENQAGFTLLELVIGMTLATVIMGSVFVVQKTSTDSFGSAVSEHRNTQFLRGGIKQIKMELRSARDSSIETLPYDPGMVDPVLEFQNAVGFDIANGSAKWGGGGVQDATIQYMVVNGNLERWVVDDQGQTIQQEVLVQNLDMSLKNGPPVDFSWDPVKRVVDLTIRTSNTVEGRPVSRAVSSVVHVESVYSF